MRPYSPDLRVRALADFDSGMSTQAVSEKYRVTTKWVRDLRRLREETGGIDPRRGKVGAKPRLAPHLDRLVELVQAKPDTTLVELQQQLPVSAGLSTIWRALKSLGLTLKKVLHAAEQQRPDVEDRRTAWKFWRAAISGQRLVFIDETGADTKMARRYGRAWRGHRLIAHVPHGHWKTTTFVAALRIDGLTAPLVVDGPMNGATFRAYVQQHLSPTLRAGDLVILDNLAAHRVAGVREAIEAIGAELIHLPPYSPDLNPIEQVFSKLKSLLRAAAQRTVTDLETTIGQLLDRFSPRECRNYFRNCGYAL